MPQRDGQPTRFDVEDDARTDAERLAAQYPPDSVEGHLRNCRAILWAIRDSMTLGGSWSAEHPEWLADVNCADARIVAALSVYAAEHPKP